MHLLLNDQLLPKRSLPTKPRLKLAARLASGADSAFVKKLLMQVKLTVVLLCTLLFDVQAEVTAQRVNLSLKRAKIETVLSRISNQTGYVFFYADDLFNGEQSVNVNIKNADLQQVLSDFFIPRGYKFIIEGKNVAIRKDPSEMDSLSAAAVANRPVPVTMKGMVQDAQTGEPLEGVSIVNKASKVGTSTNREGKFTIVVEKGAVLVFSYTGYQSKEITASTSDEVIVSLTRTGETMFETVVVSTGIYNRKQESYTGSVLTVSNEELRKVGNANVFQALRNISPSMFLDNFALGSSPNALPNMQIRGTSTFGTDLGDAGASLKGNYVKNPNEPLFILDGFEATLERIFDLDINRIEKVTILKDAASKAIYGSRAANGVVVIETKKTAQAQTLVHYNASIDIDMPDLTSYNLADATEKLQAELIDGVYLASDAAALIRLQQLYESRRRLVAEGLNTYWLAKPLRNGIGQRHTIGVELGGKDLRLMGDVAYRDVQGVMIGSNRKNITANMIGSYRLNNLLFRNIMSVNSNQAVESPYGQFSDYVRMNPYWRAENLDGTIPYLAEVAPNGERFPNPLFNSTINTRIASNYFNFTNNFYLEWDMAPGLKSITRVGIDVKNNGADEFYPSSHTRFDNFFGDLASRKGSYQMNTGRSNFLSGDFNINYSKTIDKHTFFGNVGFNINERKFEEYVFLVEGFPSERMENILLGRGFPPNTRPTGLDGIAREAGFLGAFSYMFDNRFFTDLTIRRSGSSQFGSERRWGNFWSAGLGWNLHKETYFSQFKWLDQFRLRGSVGLTGNPNFTFNASVPTYAYNLLNQYGGFPGTSLRNLANTTLQWESKLDYNVGTDIKIGRLNIRADYYQSYTENLVTSITIPGSTGFSSVSENLGRVKNWGAEIYANYVVWQRNRDFLSLNFAIETNKNKIVSLSNAMRGYNDRMDKLAADRSNSVPVRKFEDGLSMNAIWAVPSLGIDPATGNEIYLDRNGNTTYEWNALDMKVVGNSLPTYQGIFGISGEFNRIGFTVTGRYLGGGDLYNQTLIDRVENVDMSFNVDRRVLTGRWLQPGQNTLFKRLGEYSRDNGDGTVSPTKEFTRATSRFVQERNELNIAAVNVYYYLSDQFAKKLRLQRLKIAANMNEVAQFSSIRIERGTSYPFARTLSLSLSATF